jgi:XTP/dITP diphosphohydrolase
MAARLSPGDKLVLASHNKGKLEEFRVLLSPYGIVVVSAGDYGVPEPEETGVTFEENARLKAVVSTFATGLPALADDSGLKVEALGGAPGVYSARWAGAPRDFGEAMARVEKELGEKGALGGKAAPRANFTCVLCLATPDGEAELFEGKVFGRLSFPPRGVNGFGYDPIFIADGGELTFGEMAPDAKHAISHRAVAFAKFAQSCLPPKKA